MSYRPAGIVGRLLIKEEADQQPKKRRECERMEVPLANSILSTVYSAKQAMKHYRVVFLFLFFRFKILTGLLNNNNKKGRGARFPMLDLLQVSSITYDCITI